MDPRPGAANRMVGRDAELRRVRDVVVAGEGARVALIGGEAGIGKTRLVDEALADATPHTLILRLQGDQARRSRPFGALTTAVEHLVRDWTELPPPLLPRESAARALLTPVAPSLEADDPGLVQPDQLERAAIDLLRHLAPDLGSLVVVADDLHWLDPETIGVLQQLVAGVPGLDDVVVVGTYRTDDLLSRSPLSSLLSVVERRHDAVNLRLDHLGLDDVADFAAQAFGRDVPYRAVKALHQRSGGNPFFLQELVAVAQDAGLGSGVDSIADLPLPWTVAELLRDTVSSLTDDEREVVETAAVLGQRVPFDLLARVTGLPERELIARLRGAVAAGLLIEDEIDVFCFRHALVRESIAGALLGRERRRLHESALEVLLASDDADDAAIAHHALAAGRIDEMLDAVRRAATAALRSGTPYQALDFAETGLTEVPDDVALREVATRAAWLVGALDDAAEHGNRWVSVAVGRHDLVEESRARRVLMRIGRDAGDDVASRREFDCLRTLVDSMEPGEPRAATLADLAQASMLTKRSDDTAAFAERAIREADEIGAEIVRAQATVELWSNRLGDGDGDEHGVAEMLRAVGDAERLGDHITAARGLNNIVNSVPLEDRRAIVERMRSNAEQVGFAAIAAYSYAANLADLASLSAERAELERWLTDAWRWSRLGMCDEASWLEFFDTLLITEADDPGYVVPRGFRPHPDDHGEGFFQRCSRLLRAARSASASDAAAALDGLEFEHRVKNLRSAPWMTEAALRAGVPADRVRAELEQTIPADLRSGPLWAAVEVFLAAAVGYRSDAERFAEQVGDEIERWLHGELELRLAELALGDDDHDASARHAGRASALLTRWPGWRRDRAEALQRRLERRIQSTGEHDLSARELEVVTLLAQGLTNAQIAERLFIARKTAAVHVSNILAKLGMRSRTEVAAWALRTGVVPSAAERAG